VTAIFVVNRVLYRARQFFRGLRPALTACEVLLVDRALSPAQRKLFLAMDARDRRHSVDIVAWLEARTSPSADLVTAALLHDVGKGHLGATARIAYVLLGVVPLGLRTGLLRPEQSGFQGDLWRLEHHAALGARRLNGTASPRVIALVEAHTRPDLAADDELSWLIAADNAC
jgi:hypothetical protein